MKNIHILPTDKTSRLIFNSFHKSFCYQKEIDGMYINDGKVSGADFWGLQKALNNGFKPQHIYITSDEKIKEDYVIAYGFVIKVMMFDKETLYFVNGTKAKRKDCKKIILTTDQDLIKNGVQAIEDNFLEWFVKNPSCEWVETEIVEYGFDEVPICIYKIIIPKEETKQDLEKEMFELEQELDIPSHLRWYNSKPKQETLEPILYNIGDNIIIINPTENQPKSFTTHKVDNNFGVVYYYQLDGKEESIGFSHIKKEEPKQDLEKEIFELEQELPKTEIDWSGFPKSTQEKVKNKYSEEEILKLINALNRISQFSDVGNDFLAVVQIKSIAIDAIKQFKNK